ncbi:hypothetical protein O181_032602 [Austropuccinia psidii MF-1]|uniref:Uncharacterized protein n=1 Tax=Austropuccinia psidii MF-1 TaxID=1389203 RepID=A0A9Q3D2X3_9BASI|nr:hypothetical protein [Austropuccinia psidii MF-1]
MYSQRFNLASHWGELGASFQKICLKEIDFKELMVITKGWNPTRQFRLLEVRAYNIRDNQATIPAIEERLTQTGHTQIPSGSQGAGQISFPVASYHSEPNRSVAKSHHSSQSQEISRRRLSQPQIIIPLNGCCRNSNLNPSYGQLDLEYVAGQLYPLGALWTLGHNTLPLAISCPHWPILHLTNPQAIILVFGLGGSFWSSRGIWLLGPTLYIRGVLA